MSSSASERPAQGEESVMSLVRSHWRQYRTAAGALAFYFTASIALTMFNKWFFAEDKDHHRTLHGVGGATMPPGATAAVPAGTAKPAKFFSGTYHFHFPLTVTCIHQFLVWVLVLLLEKRVLVPLAGEINRDKRLMWAICPIGMLCGIDWGLSNTSLRFIPLSLYEIVKSVSPMFVLMFSFALGMAQPTRQLICIIGLISFGMFLAVSGGRMDTFSADNFPMTGFICVSCAAVLAGIRVVLAQRVMQKAATPLEKLLKKKVDTLREAEFGGGGNATAVSNVLDERVELLEVEGSGGISNGNGSSAHRRHHTNSPNSPAPMPNSKGRTNSTSDNSTELPPVNAITTLYYAAPASAISLVIPALVVESHEVIEYFMLEPKPIVHGAVFWILASSSVAFLLSMSEFVVTRKTSALTLCVTGISKQVLIIGLAMWVFGDKLRLMNILGFCVTLLGIVWYNYYKLSIQHAVPFSPSTAQVQPLSEVIGGGGGGVGGGSGEGAREEHGGVVEGEEMVEKK